MSLDTSIEIQSDVKGGNLLMKDLRASVHKEGKKKECGHGLGPLRAFRILDKIHFSNFHAGHRTAPGVIGPARRYQAEDPSLDEAHYDPECARGTTTNGERRIPLMFLLL